MNFEYACVTAIERTGKLLVDEFGIVAFDEIRRIALAFVEGRKFFVSGARLNRGTGNFVAVEMQNRQDCAVPRRIQELNSLPAAFERASFRLTIAHNTGHDQIGIIEGRAECVD